METQNSEGGWRYFPQRSDADLSVTVCQVMALRAARNAGIHIPNRTYTSTTLAGTFVDPEIPEEYAPFSIQNLSGVSSM